MKYSLGISNFLEEISSLSHSIIFLYFFALIPVGGFLISSCYSLELCIHMGIFLFLLCLSLLFFFIAVCKASSDNHFAFLHFFFFRMVLITASCIMSWTSIHSSSGILPDLIPWIYLSLSLNGPAVFPTFFNLSLNFAISSWSEPQSTPCLLFTVCIELFHLQLQRI